MVCDLARTHCHFTGSPSLPPVGLHPPVDCRLPLDRYNLPLALGWLTPGLLLGLLFPAPGLLPERPLPATGMLNGLLLLVVFISMRIALGLPAGYRMWHEISASYEAGTTPAGTFAVRSAAWAAPA